MKFSQTDIASLSDDQLDRTIAMLLDEEARTDSDSFFRAMGHALQAARRERATLFAEAAVDVLNESRVGRFLGDATEPPAPPAPPAPAPDDPGEVG